MDLNIKLKIKTEDIFIEKIELDCIIKSDIDIEITEEELRKNIVNKYKIGHSSVILTDACRLKIKWVDSEAPIAKKIWFYYPVSKYIKEYDGHDICQIIKEGLNEYYKGIDLSDIFDKIKYEERVKKVAYIERDLFEKIKDLTFKYEHSFNMVSNALAYLGLKKRKVIK